MRVLVLSELRLGAAMSPVPAAIFGPGQREAGIPASVKWPERFAASAPAEQRKHASRSFLINTGAGPTMGACGMG